MGGGERPRPFGPDRALRSLPAVHELAAALGQPRRLAVLAARRAIEERRAAAVTGTPAEGDLTARARELMAGLSGPSLRRVLNATGVVVHTNLGRAPLAAAAREAVARVADGYSNLELELDQGGRGSRQDHVEQLLCELTGAEAALAVNNGAAAVLLAAYALAGAGGTIIVSRGQLVEIGGGFRIPEVIAASGAALVEVGTTNRTRLSDYQQALSDDAVILRVHPSNFRTVGFVEDVGIEELCGLGVPVIDDVGSGVLSDRLGMLDLAGEPPLSRSLAAGAALVCCSGDKLLGGPQAGLLLGAASAVAQAREHPLARAVRIDKLSLAALEGTLSLYRDPERARQEIPVLAMLELSAQELERRAERLRQAIGEDRCEIISCTGRVGGGALPLVELEGSAVAIRPDAEGPDGLAARLRAGDPAVIARIREDRVLLDPRTLGSDEIAAAAAAARAALTVASS